MTGNVTGDVIALRGLTCRGFHGVYDFERREGQPFVVDAVLHVDTRRAAATDDLADTADYGALAGRLAAVVEGEPVDLLETLADRLATACLDGTGATAVEVTVHKPRAPIEATFEDVAVTVRRAAGPAVLALGSNLGDRAGWLQRGLDLLAAHDRVAVRAVSGVYETAPVGGPEQGPYLNAVALLDTALPPADLLGLAHVVEAACERERTVRWGPRTLDLDLVAAGGVTSADPALTLPHPRARERAFVLVPWLDVDPAAALPGYGPVADLAARLDHDAVVRTDLTLVVPS